MEITRFRIWTITVFEKANWFEGQNKPTFKIKSIKKVNSRMLFRRVEEMVQSVKAFPRESMRTWVESPALKTTKMSQIGGQSS